VPLAAREAVVDAATEGDVKQMLSIRLVA